MLYFAHYVITEVNDEARQHALEQLLTEIEDEVNRREGTAANRIAIREESLELEIAEVNRHRDAELEAADAELPEQIDAVTGEASALEQELQERDDEKLRAKLSFRGKTLASRGQRLGANTIATLHEVAREQVGAIEQAIAIKKADLQAAAELEARRKRDEAFEELETAAPAGVHRPRRRAQGARRRDQAARQSCATRSSPTR